MEDKSVLSRVEATGPTITPVGRWKPRWSELWELSAWEALTKEVKRRRWMLEDIRRVTKPVGELLHPSNSKEARAASHVSEVMEAFGLKFVPDQEVLIM